MASERRVAAATRLEALLGWMESLADATRLRLLRLLERHELGVAELHPHRPSTREANRGPGRWSTI